MSATKLSLCTIVGAQAGHLPTHLHEIFYMRLSQKVAEASKRSGRRQLDVRARRSLLGSLVAISLGYSLPCLAASLCQHYVLEDRSYFLSTSITSPLELTERTPCRSGQPRFVMKRR